jgi:hypothetical protein
VSPQLLLVLMVALVTATLTGLLTRKSFLYLPLYWVVSVCALLMGQVIGRAAGITFVTLGQVELGTGLVITIIMMTGLHVFILWYNHLNR